MIIIVLSCISILISIIIASTIPTFVAKVVLVVSKAVAKFFGELFDRIVTFTKERAFKDLTDKEHPGLKKLHYGIRRVQDKDEVIASSISANLLFICAGLCLTILFLFYLLFLQ